MNNELCTYYIGFGVALFYCIALFLIYHFGKDSPINIERKEDKDFRI